MRSSAADDLNPAAPPAASAPDRSSAERASWQHRGGLCLGQAWGPAGAVAQL